MSVIILGTFLVAVYSVCLWCLLPNKLMVFKVPAPLYCVMAYARAYKLVKVGGRSCAKS